MSNSLAMNFGSSGRANVPASGLRLIESGEINDATVVTLEFEPGGFYLLATKEYTVVSGAYRGHRLHVIAAPEEDVFGTVACVRINTLHSDNAGITITYVSNSTVTLAQNGTAYGFRYALYRMF